MADSIPPAAETGNRRTLNGLQNHLTQLIDKCQKLARQPSPDLIILNTRVKAAVDKYEQIKRHAEIYLTEMANADLTGRELQEIVVEMTMYEDKIQDQLDPLIKQISQAGTQSNVSSSTQQSNATITHIAAELPKVQLPYFEGKDEDDWDTFWRHFDSIINSKPSLKKATKFQYLQGQLRGEARQVIANLSLTDDDYDHALQLLQDNYSDKETAIARLSYKLLDLPSPNKSYESLQSFRLSIESIIKALSTKVPVGDAEWLIKLIIQRKLPNEVIDSLCTHYNTNILSQSQIIDGLRAYVQRLRSRGKLRSQEKIPKGESTDKSKNVQNGSQKSRQQNSSSAKWKQNNVGSYAISPTVNRTVGNQAPKTDKTKGATSAPKCLFCQEAHTIYQCTVYEGRASRIDRLKSLNRCIRCLRKHDTSECITQLQNCQYCHKSVHHTALCGDINTQSRSQTSNNQPASQAKPKDDNTTTAVQFCTVMSNVNDLDTEIVTAAILPTAQLELCNQGICIPTRGFFDQGSQKTFISKKMAEDLQLKSSKQVSTSISGFFTNSGRRTFPVVKLNVCLGTSQRTVEAIVVDKIPTEMEVTGLTATIKFLKEKGIQLADPLLDSDYIGDIGILIGADYYHRFILGSEESMGMNILKSAGGILMTGPILDLEPSTPEKSHHTETVIVA
ncbi:uncharacterized protein [Procambarus clarkii]|uniref:uncharacterized protein n=1 Tax=Procambarus clarkii TaxID=6728 RepID=UPI0037445704